MPFPVGHDAGGASPITQGEAEDQDMGDLAPGIDEDALDFDDLDTDRVVSSDGVQEAIGCGAV